MSPIDRRTVIVGALSISALQKLAHAADATAPITSLIYSPDGSLLIAGSQSGVSIRDAKTMNEVDHIVPQMDNVHDLRFDRSGNTLAIAGGNPAEQGIVELIDWPARTLQHRIRWHDDVVDCVDFSTDDQRWVTASIDATCCVFDRASSKPTTRYTQHSKPVRSVRFLSNGDMVASASNDETIRVWDANSGMTIRTLHNHSGDVHSISLRPNDGDSLPMLASASSDKTIRFWQPTIGRMVRFATVPSEPLCIQWNRNGTRLFAGCRDGSLRSVDPASVHVENLRQMSPAWLYAMSVDPSSERRVAVGDSDGSVNQLTI